MSASKGLLVGRSGPASPAGVGLLCPQPYDFSEGWPLCAEARWACAPRRPGDPSARGRGGSRWSNSRASPDPCAAPQAPRGLDKEKLEPTEEAVSCWRAGSGDCAGRGGYAKRGRGPKEGRRDGPGQGLCVAAAGRSELERCGIQGARI